MNYPNGIKKDNINKNITYKNRGMNLENDLNITNNYYIENNIAFIYKKPTPVNLSLLKHKIFANHCKMVIFLSNLTFCYCVRFVRLI